MTDRDLHIEFCLLNDRFFDNRIVLNRLVFSAGNLPEDASACYHQEKKWIVVSSKLREFHNIVNILLIHEMVHAFLHTVDSYRGYPCDGGHGGRFQSELDRLYRMGAYDGLFNLLLTVGLLGGLLHWVVC